MRILGVDPGLRRTGFGVVELHGVRVTYVASGVILVPVGALPRRLKTIFDGLAEVIRTWRPDQAAIEQVFVNVNAASTLLLGQARGAAITALAAGGLPVAEYAALQIKQAVVGTGRAGKDQVQHMVVRLLDLPGAPQADAADALACALCHAHGGALDGALQRASRVSAGASGSGTGNRSWRRSASVSVVMAAAGPAAARATPGQPAAALATPGQPAAAALADVAAPRAGLPAGAVLRVRRGRLSAS